MPSCPDTCQSLRHNPNSVRGRELPASSAATTRHPRVSRCPLASRPASPSLDPPARLVPSGFQRLIDSLRLGQLLRHQPGSYNALGVVRTGCAEHPLVLLLQALRLTIGNCGFGPQRQAGVTTLVILPRQGASCPGAISGEHERFAGVVSLDLDHLGPRSGREVSIGVCGSLRFFAAQGARVQCERGPFIQVGRYPTCSCAAAVLRSVRSVPPSPALGSDPSALPASPS